MLKCRLNQRLWCPSAGAATALQATAVVGAIVTAAGTAVEAPMALEMVSVAVFADSATASAFTANPVNSVAVWAATAAPGC